MATSTINNTILDPLGVAVASVRVVARLMPTGGFRSDTATEVARLAETTSASDGTWSLTLERNSNITPSDTYYEITEFIPVNRGGTRKWFIQVGASNQTVLAALVDPLPDASTQGYLTQDAADARYQALGSYGTSPATVNLFDAGTGGVAASASRSDHEHPVVWSPPSARVFRSTNQSCSNAAFTTITFDSEQHDTGLHSIVSNTERITFTQAGLYVVGFWGTLDVGAYDHVEFNLRINAGSAILVGCEMNNASVGFGKSVAASTTYKFAAGDFIDIRIFQQNAAAAARNLRANENAFWATYLGTGA